jgi:hypothetical protein
LKLQRHEEETIV